MVTMACICHRHINALPSLRAFSTSARRSVSLHIKSNLREDVANVVPEYPYGSAQWYKQSNRGLYGGSKVQFGNVSGAKHRVRVRRKWSLNVKRKRLYSEALDRSLQLQVTTRVLRTIKRFGGLDEYLLGEKVGRIKELGETGWFLRWALMQTDTVKDRFATDKQRLEAQLAKEMEAMSLARSSNPFSKSRTNNTLSVEPPIPTSDFTIETKPQTSVEPPLPETITEVAEPSTITTRPATTPRLRRLTFRIDRKKHAVFNGSTWRAQHKKAARAAWERDVVKVSRLQRGSRTAADEQVDIESAARYIEASLDNKKLQRGMPPSIVAHRRWLKQSGGRLQTKAKMAARESAVTQPTVLRESLRHKNQSVIASALARRAKANAYRR